MRLFKTLLGVLAVASGADAQVFSLHIETAPGQSQFRVGEAIGLELIVEMTLPIDAPSAGQRGWMVTLTGRDRSVLGFGRDRFVVTPEAGTRDPWSYRLHEGMAYSGPGGTYLGDKPVVLHLDLNQWVRFERPGNYTVHALFHAMGPQRQDSEIESNQIGIDIIAADPQWQERNWPMILRS